MSNEDSNKKDFFDFQSKLFKKVEFECPKHGLVQGLKMKNENDIICIQCSEEESAAFEKELNRQMQEGARRNEILKLGIVPLHVDSTFDKYIPQNEKSKRFLQELINFSKEPKNHFIIIYGKPGTGKTMMLSSAVKENKGLYIIWKDFSNRLKASYSTSNSESEYELMKEVCTVPFLAIDEIEKESDSPSDKAKISKIFRQRYENKLPIWVAGEFSWSWLQSYLEKSILDRCFQVGKSYNFDWESFRSKL